MVGWLTRWLDRKWVGGWMGEKGCKMSGVMSDTYIYKL